MSVVVAVLAAATHGSRVADELRRLGLRVMGEQAHGKNCCVLAAAAGAERAEAARAAMRRKLAVDRVFLLPHACSDPAWLTATPLLREEREAGLRLDVYPPPALHPLGAMLHDAGARMIPSKRTAAAVLQVVSAPAVVPHLLWGVCPASSSLDSVVDEPDVACRAHHKLADALDVLGMPAVPCRALDVGAAPGGWSECLLARGAELVVAVDPAQLTIPPSPRLVHVRALAERALPEIAAHAPYGLLVCDANIRVDVMTGIILQLRPYLADGARVVLTLKLHNRRAAAVAAGQKRVEESLGAVLEGVEVLWLMANTLNERTVVGRLSGGLSSGRCGR